MAIENSNYEYTIEEGDSLTRIAEKHGLKPTTDWARRIWEDNKNSELYIEADMHGKKVKRQLHLGGNHYEPYEHFRYRPGYDGYDDPHRIIVYVGEKIWIPEAKRIRHELTDEELIEGFQPEHGKKYELVFPVFEIVVELEEDEYNDGDKFTLCGYDKDNKENIIYKKTLIMKDDAIKKEGAYPRFKFVGTPRKLLYSLECTPEKPLTKDGESIEKYFIFEDRNY